MGKGLGGFVSPGEAAMLEGKSPSVKIPLPPLRRSSSDLWFLSYLPLALSDGLSTPLIPLIAIARYDPSPFVVTAIIAASTVFEVPCMILWGNLSDRVRHRKWFLVASFGATGLLLFLMSIPTSIGNYFLLNLAEGIASAAGAPVGTVLLLETRNKRWWARDLGLFGLISGFGAVLGLVVGSVWFILGTPAGTQFNGAYAIEAMRWLLALSGALAIGGAFTAAAWVEEPHSLLSRASLGEFGIGDHGVIERLRRTRRRVLHVIDLTRGLPQRIPAGEYSFLAAMLVMSIGFQVFYGPFPVFLTSGVPQGAYLSQQYIFMIYLASAAFATGLFYHSGIAVELSNPKWVFIASLLARAALVPLFFLVPHLVPGTSSGAVLDRTMLLVGLNGAMGVTWAFLSTASTLFLLRLVHGRARGKALGWYNALAGLGGLAGTLWGGLLYGWYGVETTFLISTVIVLVGAALLLTIRFHTTPFEPRPPEALTRRVSRRSAG